MQTYIVTLWNPEDGEVFLAAEGQTTPHKAQAARFTDIHHAEAAASRIIGDGWAYAIEEDEL